MISISLCMIVKNEEDVIYRCLESINGLADEIIIVDTGSTDRTKEIVSRFTTKIYDFQWIDDFSEARNFSFSKATMDYILWLDADDVILEADRLKLKQLKKEIDPNVDIVMMKYVSDIDNEGNINLFYFRERLLKREKAYKWQDPIHEYINISGNVINSDISIIHKGNHSSSDRNLKIFEKMIQEGRNFSPRNLYYYGKELYYSGRNDEAIVYLNKFISSNEGWIEDKISACFDLANCYDNLGEKENMLNILLKSFHFEKPRAEICCKIGRYFMEKEEYEKAIFWYELVTQLSKPENSWGFVSVDYWGYIPCIQLCVCYYKIGNLEKSIKFNDMAAEYKPNDPSVLFNKNLFENLKIQAQNPNETQKKTKLTLSMIIKNEAGRYLKEVLLEHKYYIDEVVIIDDGSTDNSIQLCYEILDGIPIHVVRNESSKFSNEVELRKQQWAETIKTNPEWILCLDADEYFERNFRDEVRNLINQDEIDVFSFRLYDFWDQTHYREDTYWSAHLVYRPFLVRYKKEFEYRWRNTPQHCGRLPENILSLPNAISSLRLKHMGWANQKDRIEKSNRYRLLDPDGIYGLKEQYDSILDENPTLIKWIE